MGAIALMERPFQAFVYGHSHDPPSGNRARRDSQHRSPTWHIRKVPASQERYCYSASPGNFSIKPLQVSSTASAARMSPIKGGEYRGGVLEAVLGFRCGKDHQTDRSGAGQERDSERHDGRTIASPCMLRFFLLFPGRE